MGSKRQSRRGPQDWTVESLTAMQGNLAVLSRPWFLKLRSYGIPGVGVGGRRILGCRSDDYLKNKRTAHPESWM